MAFPQDRHEFTHERRARPQGEESRVHGVRAQVFPTREEDLANPDVEVKRGCIRVAYCVNRGRWWGAFEIILYRRFYTFSRKIT